MVRLFEIGVTKVAQNFSQIVVDVPSVSNNHLKIYSIMYNDEPRQAFVYAQDLSINGSKWIYKSGICDEEAIIGRGHAVLLSDGDKIRICDSTCFMFGAAAISMPMNIEPDAEYTQIQKKELDVSTTFDQKDTDPGSSTIVVQKPISHDGPSIRGWRFR